MDFRISFAEQIMQTPEQIIIEELKRIILMQAQEIKLLKARIADLEWKVEQLTIRKDSNNSSIPPSKDENRPPRTSSLRVKSDRKVGGQPGHEGKTLVSLRPDASWLSQIRILPLRIDKI